MFRINPCMSCQSKLTRSPSWSRCVRLFGAYSETNLFDKQRENRIFNGGLPPPDRILPTISMHINNHSSSTAIRLLHPSGFVPLVFIWQDNEERIVLHESSQVMVRFFARIRSNGGRGNVSLSNPLSHRILLLSRGEKTESITRTDNGHQTSRVSPLFRHATKNAEVWINKSNKSHTVENLWMLKVIWWHTLAAAAAAAAHSRARVDIFKIWYIKSCRGMQVATGMINEF